MKRLYSRQELVEHMKSKGIKFDIEKDQAALEFLKHNNYYKKLSAYRENYEKKPDGTYINLEFAYLQELSIIDMHFRYLIMQMCLDIEHSLKVWLLGDIEDNEEEDGYDIIRKFTSVNTNVCRRINKQKENSYCEELIDKHSHDFPVWVFVELITFGELTYLCNFYDQTHNVRRVNNKLLNVVRDIRNASSHSNCLINKLGRGNIVPETEIVEFIAKMKNIGADSRNKKLTNKFIYGIVTLLYVYANAINSETVKKRRFQEIKLFLDTRVVRKKEYFQNNDQIKSTYLFIKKVVDNLQVA